MRTSAIGTEDTHGRSTPRDQPFSHGLGPNAAVHKTFNFQRHLISRSTQIESPTVIILGAGFSYVAGLPLAKDLFDAEMFAPSKAAERRFSAVLQSWRAWQSTHPGHGPEQFLTEIYHSPMIGAVPWVWAVETVATALATPLPRDRGTYQTRYAGRITRPVNVPEHIAFWTWCCLASP